MKRALIIGAAALLVCAGAAYATSVYESQRNAYFQAQSGSGTKADPFVLSSGGGGGGASTIADGADVAEGTTTDAACSTDNGTCTVIALVKRNNQRLTTVNTTLGTPLQAGGTVVLNAETTKVIGVVRQADGSGLLSVGDPCQSNAKTYTKISITSATTTNIITGASAKKTYICNLLLTSAIAGNVGIVEGTTGGTCGSGTAGIIGGTTAANGPNFAANGGVAIGNGGFAVAATATNQNDVCLITSAAGPWAGVVSWVQQ